MKKIHWLRRLTLLLAMFGVGAAAATVGVIPIWIKFILVAGIGGHLLLMAEFEYEQQKKAISDAAEISPK